MNHDLQEFLLLMLAVALVAALSGCGEVDEVVTARIVKETDEKQALPPQALLTHPLEGCTAWVMRSGTPGEVARPRCYYPRSSK